MTVEILRRRMDDDVRAVLDRPEVDGARERRIDDESDPLFLREVTHRPEIEHATGRIHRRLDEDRARLLAHLAAPNACLGRIEQCDVDAEGRELTLEETLRAAVDPGTREQVVAG